MPTAPQLGLSATDLDIRYDAAEDRLILTARGGDGVRVDLMMTRRLTRAVLGGLVDLLVRSNADAVRAESGQRHDVMLFEHLAALERQPVVASATASSMAVSSVQDVPVPDMLRQVDISVIGVGLALSLVGSNSQRSANFRLSRDSGHRLLHALMAKCREAHWDFSEYDWIDRRANMVVPSGLRPC